jgi:RNA 2',3'-cyclic 3'-phosphodiesterase
MDAIRAFIAIELPETLRRELDSITHKLQEQCAAAGGEGARKAVRWVPASNIHLTLKFLGEVSTANVQALARMLKTEATRHIPFDIEIAGLGAFPNVRRPRVIWVGSEAPPNLAALQRAIEAETRALGYPTEERPFSPHLTLGRISQNATPPEATAVAHALSAVQVGSLGCVHVNQVHLFQSDLRPTGAVYTSLYAFHLGG